MEGYENVLSMLEFNIMKGLLFRQKVWGLHSERESLSFRRPWEAVGPPAHFSSYSLAFL